MIDGRGELIYVGKAKSLRARLLTYFRPGSRDPKAGRILRQTRSIVWEFTGSEFGALLRELELIRRWQPRFNVHGQPRRRRRTFVCLGRRPAPYLFLAKRPPSGAVAVFGPVFPTKAREAVRRLNDWFGLRDCPQKQQMVFADQAELFPMVRAAGCLRHEIGTCLGPCAAACTRDGYGERVQMVRAFLDGVDAGPIEKLTQEMHAAAMGMEFERAAAIRDRLMAMQWLQETLARLRQVRERHTFVYAVAGADGATTWYLIHRGFVVRALPAPVDSSSASAAAAALETVFGRVHPWVGATPSEEMDGVLLVSAWFRRHAGERALAMTAELALAVCREAMAALTRCHERRLP